jgi:hypothetical protein
MIWEGDTELDRSSLIQSTSLSTERVNRVGISLNGSVIVICDVL